MTNQEINKYRFLGALALKYRLSLVNVCRLAITLGIVAKSSTIYENILDCMYGVRNRDSQDIVPIKYLFNVETANETVDERRKAYDEARKFIDIFKVVPRNLKEIARDTELALKENNEEKLRKLRDEQDAYFLLYGEEVNYNTLKAQINETKKSGNRFILSDNDISIIAKYRLKYALSKVAITDDLGISRNNYDKREKKIIDPRILLKIRLLNDYYEDLLYSNISSRIAGKH